MYKCDCRADGSFDHRYFDLTETTVDKDGICQRCKENLAFWENPDTKRADLGTLVDRNVTVFDIEKGTSVKFTSTVDAGKHMGYKSKYGLADNLGKKDYHYNQASGKIAMLGHVDHLPEKIRKEAMPDIIMAYDWETGELLAEGLLAEVSKQTKDSKNVININLRRQSIKSKKGIVYTKNDSFDLEAYKRTMEVSEDLVEELRWRQDVISFDQEELGVKYEEDNYGTWKELLYS